jgi:protein required for attachment to host cells
MKHTWILVANASQARFFERASWAAALQPLESFSCPEARLKGVDLESDAGGHEEMGHGRGSSSFTDRTGPRAKVHDEFARKLAGYFNDGVAAHRCTQVVILASSPFLGIIKAHLGEQATKVLLAAISKDLTGLDPAALALHLRDNLPRGAPQ